MALQDEIREDLEEEVFSEFGKTVTLTTIGTPTYNDRGEIEDYTSSEASIVAVPYNIIENRQSHQPFGDLAEGDLDMAVKYDQTIAIDDIVTIETIEYRVKEISKNFLPDNVVTIVRLAKNTPVTADD